MNKHDQNIKTFTLFSSVMEEPSSHFLQGTPLHPGAVTGLFVTHPKNLTLIRKNLGNKTDVPVIFGVDQGSCDDLAALSQANAFISSSKSANAWCAVQAKSESLPSVIGFDAKFQTEIKQCKPRCISTNENKSSVEILANTVSFADSDIIIREGDVITIDGASGKVFLGDKHICPSPINQIQKILAPILVDAIAEFGPVAGWARFRELQAYKDVSPTLHQLISDPFFQEFQMKLAEVRSNSPLQIRSTVHTPEGAVQARLLDCDIRIDEMGEVELHCNNKYSGIGLLRTERLFIKPKDINNLRTYLFGNELSDKSYQKAAGERILSFQRNQLTNLMMVNSGLPTVVRTLCMPFNKLFATESAISELLITSGLDQSLKAQNIISKFKEADTFHGCRGARLHTLMPNLAKLEIQAILEASSKVLLKGGEVDLTILVSMVTVPEELQFYADLVDEVSEVLISTGMTIPRVKLATMIETTSAFLNIERFADITSKHTEFVGVLFGGNDFTAACLNLSRTDAARAMIPNYQRLGIFQRDPFFSLDTGTVGPAIKLGLERLAKVIKTDNPVFGFGGEQAGDAETVAWLKKHTAKAGLSYVATSPDRMAEVLFATVL
ncbi:MAG: putative PEP-binding protein [Candidatus Halichondribacter symbioticus]